MEEVKAFKPRATLHLPTLLQLYAGQVHSVTPHKEGSCTDIWGQSNSVNFLDKYYKN